MLVKILFTMLVIIVVGMIFKSKSSSPSSPRATQRKAPSKEEAQSLPPRIVAYLLVALLILVSGVVYYFSWSDGNEIVTLRVINAGGNLSEYQAYRKDLKGREFTSIDGVHTQLADSDRLEILIKD